MTAAPPAGWALVDGAFERSWAFPDFASALAFVVALGVAAEAEGHHPDISFGWGTATVRWTTHSAGGVTDRDAAMARHTDGLAADAGATQPD